MALDDIVPPGSTAQEAFLLMQQARIDALESELAQMSLVVQAVVKALPAPAPLQAPEVVLTDAAAAAAAVAAAAGGPGPVPGPGMMPVGAVYIGMPAAAPAAGGNLPFNIVTSRDRCAPIRYFVFCGLLAGVVCLALGLAALLRPNTGTTAQVTSTAVFVQPLCATNITYLSHGGVAHSASLLQVESAATCGAWVAGSSLRVCYRWSRPSSVQAGGCSAPCSHAVARRLLIAGIVLLSGTMAAWVLVAEVNRIFRLGWENHTLF